MTLLEFALLFDEFQTDSWSGWRAILQRLTPDTREFYAVVGRGAGKSRIVALLGCYFAAREYHLAPGENIFIGIFAPDRRQAGVTFRYLKGLMRSVDVLSGLIVRETADSLELASGVVVEVLTASTAAPRGRAYAFAIVEEAAFLRDEDSANPDVELLRALRPALARVPGSLLAVVSSPYARKGILWSAFQRYHGKPDGAVVYVQAPTQQLNPTFDAEAVARAFEDDPASAAAEYGGEFRQDIETFISREALQATVIPGRLELAPVPGLPYTAFVDPSGGSGGDSFTLAVAHSGGAVGDVAAAIAPPTQGGKWADLPGVPEPGVNTKQLWFAKQAAKKVQAVAPGLVVLDAVREIRPPFSPESATEELADLLKAYGVRRVIGDAFGGDWPKEAFRRHGISYERSELSKSQLYQAALPLVNSGRVELLDHSRLISQFAGLERRTARGGRDSIDHAPGAHDDVANAAAGALVNVVASRSKVVRQIRYNLG